MLATVDRWTAFRTVAGMIGGYPPHPPTPKPPDFLPQKLLRGEGPTRESVGENASAYYKQVRVIMEGPDCYFTVRYANERTFLPISGFDRRDALRLSFDVQLLVFSAAIKELWLKTQYLLHKMWR